MNIFFSFIKKTFIEYSKYSLWLLPVAILIRLFEASLIYYSERAGLFHLIYLNFRGGFYDILVFVKWALIGFPVFAILYYWHQKIAAWVFRILFALMLCVSVFLIIYFVITGLPLDSSILNHFLKEFYEISAGSATTVWWAYPCILLFPVGYIFISSIKLPKIQYLSLLFLIMMILGWAIPNVKRNSYIIVKDYYTVVNKEYYLLQTMFGSAQQHQIVLSEISDEELLAFQSHFPDLTFENPQYPFLHKEETPDRLSSFFQHSNNKPNIVLIIVEGLARTFSGKNSEYPSPTPYLNALAEEGLSWENCFATSEKTFGVLPALLGALPSGIDGFLAYQKNAPDAHTLCSILNHNGYATSFFYGGPVNFDGMAGFLNQNGVSKFLNADDYKDAPERNDLGLHDMPMFEAAIKTINFSDNKPRLDIYLTLTSQDPFDFPNEQEYLKQYSDMLMKSNFISNFSEKNMKALSSFLYVDNAIKELIASYRNEAGFDNTVFIITGTHNYDISLGTFSVTRVPFIIWSPLLVQNGSFPAIVSHRELTPSLLAMLRQQYGVATPDKVAWLNTGLDTCTHFQSVNFIPQMSGNRELVYFFCKNHFVDFDLQYDIAEKEEKITFERSNPLTQELSDFINTYKKFDRYVMDKAMLLESEQPIGKKITLLEYEKTPDVHILEGEFPLNLIEKVPLSSSYQKLEIEYEFAIKTEEINRELRVVTEIVDASGNSKHWSLDGIVKTEYFPLDGWLHYEFHQTYKANIYDFKTGDKVSAYIWNMNSGHKIYIKNLKVKVTAYTH